MFPQNAAVFAAVFIALYTGHVIADHWVQSSHAAVTKGQYDDPAKGHSSRAGRRACAGHVASLTFTLAFVLALVAVVLQLPVTVAGAAAGLGVNAVSHFWADRRRTLQRLAEAVNKGEFYALGATTVDAEGKPAPHIGTGAYALDQSWHVGWLLIAALLVTVI